MGAVARSAAAQAVRAIDPLMLLMRDHAALLPCIRALGRTRPSASAEDDDEAGRHEERVGRLCADWSAHLQLDEELFVPAARRALGAFAMPPGPMAWDPRPGRALIQQLDELETTHCDHAPVLARLIESILAHCREEQSVLFPQLREGGRLDPALGAALAARRAALRADITGRAPALRSRPTWPAPCRLALGLGAS